MFQFESQQNFIDFAGVAFFGRQIHIARHLHGDGRGALAFGAPHIGQTGPNHPDVVHTAVREKPGIFYRQHRVFHHLRDVADGCQAAPFFAKLPNQHGVGGVHPQRQLGPIVEQIGYVGQIGIRHCQRYRYHQHYRQCAGHSQTDNPGYSFE